MAVTDPLAVTAVAITISNRVWLAIADIVTITITDTLRVAVADDNAVADVTADSFADSVLHRPHAHGHEQQVGDGVTTVGERVVVTVR